MRDPSVFCCASNDDTTRAHQSKDWAAKPRGPTPRTARTGSPAAEVVAPIRASSQGQTGPNVPPRVMTVVGWESLATLPPSPRSAAWPKRAAERTLSPLGVTHWSPVDAKETEDIWERAPSNRTTTRSAGQAPRPFSKPPLPPASAPIPRHRDGDPSGVAVEEEVGLTASCGDERGQPRTRVSAWRLWGQRRAV